MLPKNALTALHRIFPMLMLAPLAAVPLGAAGAASVGEFADHGDVGGPALPGAAIYDATTQEYRLTGAGTNLWGSADQFHFAWNRMKGDFILRARFAFVGQGRELHRKLGWMIRTSLDGDSAYADGCAHGNGLTSLQFRRSKGAVTEEQVVPLKGGDVIQLERRGGTYIFSAARYGETFVSTALTDIELGDEVFVGLFLCSHNGAVQEQAIFRDVRIVKPAKPDFRPYQDYIGSQLEVLNVFTGQLAALHRSMEPFEAPNWMPDNRTLLVNVSGRGPAKGVLRLYDRTTGEMRPFDSGEAIHNNNDHVLSFDGKWLAVSNHAPESGGKSAVYTLPATGGPAKRITPSAPSYLHGWSPDAQWLVYTGGRKLTPDGAEKYDIYKIPAAGGDEVRLTDSPGLNDGPEYSPDGKYIYFNSTRTGLMQIWRMKPDGSEQEQVTRDAYNNWFAHLSPDGKWMVFVSYGAHDVRADDHPYYKHVYLRMLPTSGGGEPRAIAYVYGGQGTMNVPSWSPDGRQVAFVSNTVPF